MSDSLKQTPNQVNLDPVETPSTEPETPNLDDFIQYDDLEAPVPQTPVGTRKPQNTQVDPSYTKNVESHDDRRERIALPTSTIDDLGNILDSSPTLDFSSGEEGANWVNTLNQGVRHLRVNDIGLKALEDETSEFVHTVTHESGNLVPGIQRGRVQGGSVVSGEKAILGLRSSTGLGVIVRKPMWHSGVWLSMKTPSELALIEVQRSLTQAKVELGRHTWGLAGSATSGLISEEYFDLIIDNFYQTSAKDKEALLDHLLVNDLPILQWQLACAVYPNGFQYSRACTCNPTKCTHVSKELINPIKLLYVDRAKLTQEQLNHMSQKASGTMDTESIKRYQSQHLKGQKRELTYTINGNEIKILLKVPTLREYFNSTHDWIDRLHERVTETLGVDASHKDRNAYINQLSVSTTLRQYAHYVESIDYGDTILDRDTIYAALDSLSSEPDITDRFEDDVQRYINDTTVALIGIPDFKCPKCKGAQITEEQPTALLSNVIPIDPLTTFFTLHSQKLSRLSAVG